MSVDSFQNTSPSVAIDLGRRVLRRGAVVVALLGIALVHLLDVKGKLQEVPYIGVMFIALIASSLVLAELLIRTDDPRVWLASGMLAGMTLFGYIVSRSVGMPGDGGADIGNWFEPLGLASLLIETVVLVSAVARLADQPKR